MEPRISSLIDPALLSEDVPPRAVLPFHNNGSELPFDAVRQPNNLSHTSRPGHVSQVTPLDSINRHHKLPKHSNASSKPTASSMPLAEVLNSEQNVAVVKESLAFLLQDQGGRRKRKDDNNDRLKLPQLPAPAKKVRRPRIPPLLPGLYEPPPDAGLFPAITTDAPAPAAPPLPPPNTGSKPPVSVPEASPAPPVAEAKQKEPQPKAPESVILQYEGVDDGDVDESLGFMVLDFPGITMAPAKTPKKSKDKKMRMWTTEETKALAQGAHDHGIGNWTTILNFNREVFKHRSAHDLKDRFRTCYPEQYKNSTKPRGAAAAAPVNANEAPKEHTNQPAAKSATTQKAVGKPSKRKQRTGKDDVARLGIDATTFKQSGRRARLAYSTDEDEALLKGVTKHGRNWQKIRADSELKLSDRTATDLRDHFRLKLSKPYTDAGGKLPEGPSGKHREQDSSGSPPPSPLTKSWTLGGERTPGWKNRALKTTQPKSNDTPSSIITSTQAIGPIPGAKDTSGSNAVPAQAIGPIPATKDIPSARLAPIESSTAAAAPKHQTTQLMPLNSILDPFDDDFLDFDSDDFVDPHPTNLHRGILDWAEQHLPQNMNNSMGEVLPGISSFPQPPNGMELPSFVPIDPAIYPQNTSMGMNEVLPGISSFPQPSNGMDLPSFVPIDPALYKLPRARLNAGANQAYVPSAPLSGIITDNHVVENNNFS